MPTLAKDSITITGTIVKESEKALLFSFTDPATDSSMQEWFPFSQIDSIDHSSHKGEDKITISKWIAEKKGIEVD